MNVTLTSLEALILKATHESLHCPDAAALEAFCAVMRDSSEGPQLATQALAARIHSVNSREAMLALSMIDRCMRRGDVTFHAEVGKFRFLNELIKLVSPKYLADRTAPEVRTRVLQLLHAWSLEYPKESKFKVAYEMLKFQGVVKETPPPLPPEEGGLQTKSRVKNAIFEDEEKSKLLQKLLQSKKAEDIQHANRLIKTMVREEERRSEACSRRAAEVAAALDSSALLGEMLARAADASPDERLLIRDLHDICARARPALQRRAAAGPPADNLGDILRAIDLLDEVQEKYKLYVNNEKLKGSPSEEAPNDQPNSESLLDFAGANINKEQGDTPKNDTAKNNAIVELGDIFSTESGTNNIAEPLKPVSLLPIDDMDLLGEKTKVEGWNELDSLGEQLMKQSLPDNARRDNFNSKTKKVPMNALTSPKHELAASNGAMFDLDYFIKKPEQDKSPEPSKPSSPADDVMVDISTDTTTNNINNNITDNILDLGLVNEVKSEENIEMKGPKDTSGTKISESIKPLTDINVTLECVTPSGVSPLTAFEEPDGVTVVLHFCKDKPRPDVNVIVISTTSKNRSPIEDYKFQGVVPKGCKVRLLPPSGTFLPAFNPFLPPPALTQVMLVARPQHYSAPLFLKFVVTYTCDNDTYSEMGEVTHLPLDHI